MCAHTNYISAQTDYIFKQTALFYNYFMNYTLVPGDLVICNCESRPVFQNFFFLPTRQENSKWLIVIDTVNQQGPVNKENAILLKGWSISMIVLINYLNTSAFLLRTERSLANGNLSRRDMSYKGFKHS